jgi:alpha-D-ribose 1-methylphosphonate 5-triphosphate synthase subunit PhnH
MTRERALHSAFRAVLAALAQPGCAFEGPFADGIDAGRRTATLALDAIWDGATPMHVAAPARAAGPPLPLRFEMRSAAANAASVLIVEGAPEPALLLAAKRGSDEAPEDGATFVCIIDAAARTPARLRGPGIDGEWEIALPLSPAALAARAEACGRYPLGIDLVFFERDGRVVGLPRTTSVEILR